MDIPEQFHEQQEQRQQALGLQTDNHHEDIFPLEGASTSLELRRDADAPPESGQGCPVCGDKISGYHYGLLTCESCKGFFKRSVQNDKRYTCAEAQSCPMNVAQRKRCPFCRFQKCLAVGMKKEAVRADRMRGGRNKFGPFYRLMKEQKVYPQSNTDPYRDKMETAQRLWPAATNYCPLMCNHMSTTHSQNAFHPSPVYPSGTAFLPSDDRVVPPLPFPHAGTHHQAFPGYHPEEMPTPLSSGPHYQPLHRTPSSPYMLRTPSPCSSIPPTPPPSGPLGSPAACAAHSSSDFLAQLLEGEPDESQLCAKVVASLQREQANRGKHDCLNTFSIMCKMADQTLFGLVEWARNSSLFKELKVEDQMVLLQSCWSELLVLDHLCRQVTYGKQGCIYLVMGQQIEMSTIISQAGAKLSSLVTRTQDLVSKLKALQFDRHEFVCLKYLVLFNPDVKSVQSRRQVEHTQERVNRALMEHTQRTHPGHSDKFGQLLLRLPEVRSISLQVEEYLYQRHLLGDLPCNSLLTEMLHTKHS
ncbi:nuclear receptor subfamily 5, group A, member 5 isoform X1 [Corythoichthys intestinalis]|uniref:nuclear receptor subfamily 5, group A, member 5 isoform X1 n=1 Tax=Corythoichthys intestinalis TaxID=161448 RepID=UPI0025A611C7|nr:nuclear receptor subfamily 5, group A, member 5 isoform X1 [Corythoichthys intestinalis]